MKKRISVFLFNFLFWYLFFVVGKIIFLIYQFPFTKDLTFTDFFKVLVYGSKMDLAVAGYFSVLPGLLFMLSDYINKKVLLRILFIYTGIIIFICGFLIIADMELYRFWGFRLDATPLMYLKTPKEAFASANIWISVLLLLFWIIISGVSLFLYRKIFNKKIKALESIGWSIIPVFIFLIAALIVPIRGGFGIAPLNVGAVYFSKSNNYANHAALNVFWNLGYSLSTYNEFKPNNYMEKDNAYQIVSSDFTNRNNPKYLLNTDRPNIILLIVESFSNKLIEPLGGLKGITPNINSFMHEAVVFPNCYAAGDRTDKGIVALLSGYPALPKGSIVNFPKKIEKLPCLNTDLKTAGYQVQFLQGFDMNFASLRSYFLHAKFDKVTTKFDFPSSQYNSKWGAHDEFLLDRLYKECNMVKDGSFFIATMTQSSHEPFDVPMKTVIHGKDEESLFLNAAVYTDSCIGEFIRKARTTEWWKNTLVVLVADHGNRHPGNTPNNLPSKFKIPMIWLGGALAVKDTIIETYFSQNDFPLTMLHQLKLDNNRYRFSKDFLSKGTPSFGFYVFNNGFAIANAESYIQVDNVSKKTVFESGVNTKSQIERGKALMQVISTDFSER